MRIFIHSKPDQAAELWTGKLLQGLDRDASIRFFRTPAGFSRGLRRPLTKFDILVFVGLDTNEILDLLCVRDMMGDAVVVLVLHDRKPEDLEAGYRLGAHLIWFSDNDPGDLQICLKRMMTKAEWEANGSKFPFPPGLELLEEAALSNTRFRGRYFPY